MPSLSLVELCTKVCIKNVRSLTDVGDFQYWSIRTVLQRIVSPEQLHQIELNSPQIRGEDAELWRAFIARDVPNWKLKNYHPKNPLKWYEVYRKYKKEQRREIERDEEILRNSMLGIKKDRETHVSKVVDLRTLPKVPRDPRMLANNGGVPIGRSRGFVKPGPSSLTWNSGSKTKLTDGRSVLTRARREAKEICQRSKLAKPTHDLKGKAGQVTKAPAGMVNEYRKAAEPALRILARKRKAVSSLSGGISGPSLEEREQKLRALTRGASSRVSTPGAVKETLVSSSEDEDDDNDVEEFGDLFGESKLHQPPPVKVSASRTNSSSPLSSWQTRSGPSSTSNSTPITQPFGRLRHPPLPSSSSSSSPTSKPALKPSELISSIISKSKASPSLELPSAAANHPASSTLTSHTSSPTPGTPRPTMPRKRVAVDVFNRGSAKKPKIR